MKAVLLKHTLGFIFLVVLSDQLVFPQQQKITGTLTNSITGNPVAFAAISVAGSGSGTLSDENGSFSLVVDTLSGNKLVISHINYFRQELLLHKAVHQGQLQIALDPKTPQLGEVVVSATLTEKLVLKNTTPVSIIHNRHIQDHFSSNMADLFARTPGFAQIWEYHSPLLLRGMNSNRLLMLKNGARRIGTFPGGYFGQDINVYETRKIEIIKGPGSVIYGSGAISGIISLITPEPFGKNETSVKVLTGYGSNNNEWLENVAGCWKKENSGIAVQAKWRKTGEYRYGNGETAENSQVEDRDVSVTAGVKVASNQQITVHADYHFGNWGKPRGFNGPDKYFTEIKNKEEGVHTALTYKLFTKGLVESVNAVLYYDAGKRDYYQYKHSTVTGAVTTLDLVHYKDNYGGGRIFSVIIPATNHELTLGADGYLFRIDNPTDYYDYYNHTTGADDGYENAGQQSVGFFANNDWQVGEKTGLNFGLRYDVASVNEGTYNDTGKRQEYRTAISGNLGFIYSLVENSHYTLNVGRAFRMPITEELFTETVSCKGIKQGNPELEPEYSWNVDMGYRGFAANNKWNWDISVFYNVVDNYIGEQADTVSEKVDFTYKNTDATLFGGEASLSYRFNNAFADGNQLNTGLALSYVHGIDRSENADKPLFGIPPLTLLTDLKYQGILNKYFITGYYIALEGEFSASQNRIGELPEGTDGGPWGYETADPHMVFNLLTGINANALPGKPKLRFIVKNLLDHNYKPFGSYIPAMGRNFKITLSFTIL